MVLLLLTWTAVDLTNESLCALDSTEFGTGGALTGTEKDDGKPLPGQETPRHVDDCFCCSHCVDVAAVIPVMAAEIVRLGPAAPVSSALLPPLVPPYHPPRA